MHATKLQLACGVGIDRYFQLAEMQVESDANVAAGAGGIELGGGVGLVARSPERRRWLCGGAVRGWSSAGRQSADQVEHVTLRLPAATGVSRVDLYPRSDSGNEGRGFPRDFAIQVATDDACTRWSTVAAETDYSNPGKFRRTFGFASRTTRCVRVQATELDRFADGQSRFQLAEVKLYH